MSDRAGGPEGTVIIKKYANRRLYNTRSSSYITLDYLAQMTREGVDFRVVDAKTGDDITHQILTQIIMEEEASGEQMLPVNFLRQLIAMYGNSMRAMVPSYLESAMQQFCAHQQSLGKAFEQGMESNPLAKLAEQNMAMFQAAAAAFMPAAKPAEHAAAKPAESPAQQTSSSDLDTLRAQMAAMQEQLDRLAK